MQNRKLRAQVFIEKKKFSLSLFPHFLDILKKNAEHLCLKLLGLTRPFVQEYFRCLYEGNLYYLLISFLVVVVVVFLTNIITQQLMVKIST